MESLDLVFLPNGLLQELSIESVDPFWFLSKASNKKSGVGPAYEVRLGRGVSGVA
jgi:hypothetical protein